MQDEKDIELKETVANEEERIEEVAEADDAEKLDSEVVDVKPESDDLAADFGADDFGAEFADLENQIQVETKANSHIVSSAKDANYASGFPKWYLEPPTDF